jgi:hypothetical protein
MSPSLTRSLVAILTWWAAIAFASGQLTSQPRLLFTEEESAQLQDCETALEALNEAIPDLAAQYTAMETAATTEQESVKQCLTQSFTAGGTCELNYLTMSGGVPFTNYVNVCEGGGGTAMILDVSLDCTASSPVNAKEGTVTVQIINLPQCVVGSDVTAACDPDLLLPYFSEEKGSAVIASLAETGATCVTSGGTSNVVGGGSSSTGSTNGGMSSDSNGGDASGGGTDESDSGGADSTAAGGGASLAVASKSNVILFVSLAMAQLFLVQM